MEQTRKSSALRQELDGIGPLIQAAAVREDGREWVRLQMSEAALPALIRDAEARPIREEIRRLVKNRRLAGVIERQSAVGRELDEAARRLAAIEEVALVLP